jgi:hypothetical protein
VPQAAGHEECKTVPALTTLVARGGGDFPLASAR